MKSIKIALAIILLLMLPLKVSAQMQELQQLALNIEKLAQFRAILKDMKRGYEMLTGGYNTVKDLTEGNFNLHEAFLDGLLEVSPTVRNYTKVRKIISMQITIIEKYKSALSRFNTSGLFNKGELSYMEQVYGKLFRESLRNLDELTMVLTSGEVRMSDDERLETIDRIHADMEDKLLFLNDFNSRGSILGLQRAREKHDADAVKLLAGINK
ncbi:hypothetical protein [Flavobacterium sp. fv08]|uniref:hypothetical protein n=1 Tax=Flavobacterium sp. fv08 TaxID=1761784 RepID=UPI000B866239|nr:hypothetical protein [Flavobacterium sp. fv08]